MTSRRTIRRRFRKSRTSLNDRQQQHNAEQISRHLVRSNLLLSARNVAVYAASNGEVDLAPTIVRLWAMNKTVVLPVLDKLDNNMSFFRYDPATRLVQGQFDIPVPEPNSPFLHDLAIDLMLAPLVAFDDVGTRLGMGSGYFDRWLSRQPSAMRPKYVGIAHSAQHSNSALPSAAWDVPLDAVITEHGITEFR